jgi:PIN domain nuclease of toxin-antitoxin system
VSVISCWEVAKLVEYGRLKLTYGVEQWIEEALSFPGISLIDLTPQTRSLQPSFRLLFIAIRRNQIIVATARTYDLDLVTMDDKILKYPHVKAN